MIINAENLILGRLATTVAKKSLLGEEISLVNCEKTVITGDKKEILAQYREKRARGQVFHGPYIDRRCDRFVKRAIRGMLPYKQEKGRNAFARIRCYSRIPEAFKDKEMETVKGANLSKVSNLKYITIKELCRSIGGK